MQQIWIPRIGDPTVLELREAPDPEPGPMQVRIQVGGAGVNFADVMARIGMYPDAPPLPCVVGYEVAGRIDKVGPGVSPDRVGQDVVAMCRFGGYSSVVCVDDVQAVVRPAGLGVIEAASMPVVYLTAWMMLEVMGRVRAGDRVLVHSAGGGVGLAALDLLRWRGAIAYGTASGGKHPFLLERGYHRLCDYTRVDFEDDLKDVGGFDLILDPVGGDSWAKGLRMLRAGGRLVCFGMSANATGDTRSLWSLARNMWSVPWMDSNPIALINQNKGLMGVNMGHLWHETARVAGWLGELLLLWEQGVVRPEVHATVPFSNAREAHRILHARENTGKIVLIPDHLAP